jgi:hypothetical protein
MTEPLNRPGEAQADVTAVPVVTFFRFLSIESDKSNALGSPLAVTDSKAINPDKQTTPFHSRSIPVLVHDYIDGIRVSRLHPPIERDAFVTSPTVFS